MTAKIRLSRTLWTLAVTLYFLVFFRNFFADALPGSSTLPTVFFYLLVAWLAVEYWFGSPFFQSGLVEPSPLWRGLFAFFVYPYFAYLVADFAWWRLTVIPVSQIVLAPVGLIVFGVGTYLRLRTLLDTVRGVAARTKTRKGIFYILGLATYKMCRHPRYLATLFQLVGAALFFCSWGGLVLVGLVGFPLILAQARYEDRQLKQLLSTTSATKPSSDPERSNTNQEVERFFQEVPFFWPRVRRLRQ